MDDGDNALIHYTISPPSDYFKIDAVTGDIFTTQSLDAEELGADQSSVKILEIVATDSGMPPREGRTKITIKIADINDNVPQFDQLRYQFDILEEKPIGHFIGQVHAIDYDQDAVINYRFSRTSVPFKINETTGEIVLRTRLDSEIDINIFTLTVIAEDQDGKCDTAEISIRLVDQNDNPPSLIYPLPFKDILQIKPAGRKNDVVAQINVTDRDQGNNGKVLVIVERGDNLFDISKNGTIRLTRDIQRNHFGLHPMLIRLQDMGQPSLFTTTRVSEQLLV